MTETTALRKSKFYYHFLETYNSAFDDIQSKGSPLNPMFAPHLLNEILSGYMGLVPLWTGMMLNDLSSLAVDSKSKEVSDSIITRDTTSVVENYFGIINSGLKSRQRFRVTQFIRKQKTMVQGIWNELQTVDPDMVVAMHLRSRMLKYGEEGRTTNQNTSCRLQCFLDPVPSI